MQKLLLAGLIALLAAWAGHTKPTVRHVSNKVLCTPECVWTAAACFCPPRDM